MSPSRKILVGVAWPYANGEQHIGHIAGAYLPPDIFSRYQRMIGNEVLMVSGSDTHGTPVSVRAEAEGSSPAVVVERFHAGFVESYLKLGLTFDLFTHTDTQNHWAVTQRMFRQHRDHGYIYADTQQQLVSLAQEDPGTTVSVDVESQQLTLPDGRDVRFPLDGFSKYCLLNGVDQLGYLLALDDEVADFEAKHPPRVATSA